MATTLSYSIRFTPSIWLKAVGTGSWLRASTANNFTIANAIGLAVYSGSSCGNFSCIDYDEEQFSTRGTRVTWLSNPGELYYIQMHQESYSYSDSNNVGLAVEEFELATNDDCEGAIELTIGAAIVGSTENATKLVSVDDWIDANGEASLYPDCFPRGPGAWYRVMGTGKVMRASTCDKKATDYATTINVLSGECGNLTCLKENSSHRRETEEGCETRLNYGDRFKTLTWNSTAGVLYFIHVTFDYPYVGYVKYGRFGLSVEVLE